MTPRSKWRCIQVAFKQLAILVAVVALIGESATAHAYTGDDASARHTTSTRSFVDLPVLSAKLAFEPLVKPFVVTVEVEEAVKVAVYGSIRRMSRRKARRRSRRHD